MDSSLLDDDRRDMMKIYGVKIDHSRLPVSKGRREYGSQNDSIIREERREKLPSLKPAAASVPRGMQARGVGKVLI